jgi:hypothetical protein
MACLVKGPDATPPADLALHIGELGGGQISGPLHKPCNLAHQINDFLIVVPLLDPFAEP